MQSLLKFLLRIHLFLLFVLFEIFSISLLVKHNDFQQVRFINFTRQFSGKYYERMSDFRQYLSLKEENTALAEENAHLNDLLSKISYSLQVDPETYVDSTFFQRYEYINARVVNNSVNKQRNYITLNLGSDAGIEPEMAVINGDGVVGVVTGVSKGFSTAISILNRDFKISAKIRKNGYFGSLSWTGQSFDEAILSEIPLHADIAKGDSVITSGYSTIYPEDVLIGYISEFEEIGGTFFKITVKLSVDFRKLSNVNVVKSLLKDAQLELESESHD